MAFFGLFVSSSCLVCMGTSSLSGLPVEHKTWLHWCAFCWTRPLGKVGWGITFVTSGENI